MSMPDMMRRVAGLFVELPPQAAETQSAPMSDEELDKRLAQLSQNAASLGVPSAPEAGTGRTVEQVVRDSPGPNLDEIHFSVPTDALLQPDGTIDFAALYAAASLPSVPFTAEQTIDMLGSLPATLPLEMKRQTVQVTLSAMGKATGVTSETIIADTSRKLAALSIYSEDFTTRSETFVTESEAEIAAMLQQVEERRSAILSAKQQQSHVRQVCAGEADRLDDVLEFFSVDVPPSRLAPPA